MAQMIVDKEDNLHSSQSGIHNGELSDSGQPELQLPFFDPEQNFQPKSFHEIDAESIAIYGLQSLVDAQFKEELEKMNWLKSKVCDAYMKMATAVVDSKEISNQITTQIPEFLSSSNDEILKQGWPHLARRCIHIARGAAIFADQIAGALRKVTHLERRGLPLAYARLKTEELPEWAGPLALPCSPSKAIANLPAKTPAARDRAQPATPPRTAREEECRLDLLSSRASMTASRSGDVRAYDARTSPLT